MGLRRRLCLPVLLALSIGACIPDTSGRSLDETTPSPPPGARAGGTLRIAIDEPAGIDPTDARSPGERIVARAICDTLIAIDAEGRPRPGLAESWTLAGNGTKLFVKLRKDVRFHNGRTLTADDVIYSLSRLASEDFASRSAELMRPVFGYAFVHGEAETENRRFREVLAGLRAIDGRTIEFTLQRPYGDFYLALSHPATAPVPEEEIEDGKADAFAAKPVCTGPYRVTEPWKPGAAVKLARFERYHGDNLAYSRGGRGWADALELIPFASRAAQTTAFERGDVDVAQVPDARVRTASERPLRNLGSPLTRARTGQLELIGFPTTKPPFDDVRVRRAFALALDRVTLTEVYGPGRIPADDILPEAVNPTAPRICPAPGDASSAAVQARALLAVAKVDAAKISAPFYYNDEFSNRALAEAAARRWRETLGARITPTPLPWTAYSVRATSAEGFDGIFRYGWAADYPSPDRFLVPLFHPDSVGRDNASRYGSRDFTDAIRRAHREMEPEDRATAYADAARAVCEDVPMVAVSQDVRSYARTARAQNSTSSWLSSVDGTVEVRELFVGA